MDVHWVNVDYLETVSALIATVYATIIQVHVRAVSIQLLNHQGVVRWHGIQHKTM
jgi:hypothetical protein